MKNNEPESFARTVKIVLPEARAVFSGMSMDTVRSGMTQVVLEGVAFALRASLKVEKRWAAEGIYRTWRGTFGGNKMEKNYPHHGAVAFGHLGKALYEVFKYVGMPVEDLDVNQPRGMLYPTENPFNIQ